MTKAQEILYELGKKVTDEGVWRTYNGGAQFKIGRAGTAEWANVVNRLERPYQRKIKRGTMDARDTQRINYEAISRVLLLDWKGVGKDGVAVEYTPTEGFDQLINDPELAEFILNEALDIDSFAVKNEDNIAKK